MDQSVWLMLQRVKHPSQPTTGYEDLIYSMDQRVFPMLQRVKHPLQTKAHRLFNKRSLHEVDETNEKDCQSWSTRKWSCALLLWDWHLGVVHCWKSFFNLIQWSAFRRWFFFVSCPRFIWSSLMAIDFQCHFCRVLEGILNFAVHVRLDHFNVSFVLTVLGQTHWTLHKYMLVSPCLMGALNAAIAWWTITKPLRLFWSVHPLLFLGFSLDSSFALPRQAWHIRIPDALPFTFLEHGGFIQSSHWNWWYSQPPWVMLLMLQNGLRDMSCRVAESWHTRK